MRTVGLVRRALSLGADLVLAVLVFWVLAALNWVDLRAYQPPDGWFATEWLLKSWLDDPIWVVQPALLLVFLGSVMNAGWEALDWSLGSRLMGLRVVGLDGARPPIWRVVLRWIGTVINLATLGLGYLWALADPRRMALHDILSGTCVVAARSLTP